VIRDIEREIRSVFQAINVWLLESVPDRDHHFLAIFTKVENSRTILMWWMGFLFLAALLYTVYPQVSLPGQGEDGRLF